MSDTAKNANCNDKIIAQIQNVDQKVDLKAAPKEGVSEAPTGLLAEFLSSVMLKDYQTAFKYCAQILTYEPNNTTARDFYPLILEKLEMISTEEFDHTSSDSSETYSTDSKSSGNSLNQVDSQSSDDGKKFSSGDESYTSVGEKNEDSLSTNIEGEEKQIKSENMEATESECFFTPPKEGSLKTLQSEDNSQTKQTSKEELQTKTEESTAPLSPKLLIHPTKTQILRYSSAIGEEKKKQNRTKKQKQKDQETPTVSQNQSSSKILLYPTRTITFPKITSESKLTKTENSQAEHK